MSGKRDGAVVRFRELNDRCRFQKLGFPAAFPKRALVMVATTANLRNLIFFETIAFWVRKINTISMLNDGILKGFTPHFKSIRADCDRYSNELVELIEAGKIDRAAYIDLSGNGSLWIILQYTEKGLADDVEAHVRKDMTSNAFYGPLFENTVATLAYLTERSEHDRVYRLYRAAIEHRLKALKDEAKTRDRNSSSKTARAASAKWIRHYLPAARKIIQQYEALLASNGHTDPALLTFQRSLDAVRNP